MLNPNTDSKGFLFHQDMLLSEKLINVSGAVTRGKNDSITYKLVSVGSCHTAHCFTIGRAQQLNHLCAKMNLTSGI